MSTLTISGSPHAHTNMSVSRCMWTVVIALLPAWACSVAFFGLGAITVTAVAVVACMAFEYLIARFMLGQKPQLQNGAALLTGLLLAMNLPSSLPWWIVVIGSLVAIGIGKMSFGGLGCNIFNPALVGRVFLLLSFPAQMTTWPVPTDLLHGYVDGITDATTGATVLSQIKSGTLDPSTLPTMRLLLGDIGGSLGEVGSAALLLGFALLLWRRIITWHIPVSIIASAALLSWAVGGSPVVEVLSGGLLLGAIFMATDYVTSPMTHRGMIIYGVIIGLITIIIRRWGAYPEGVSFAILLANGVTPLINRYVKPVRFGERRVAA